jgi:ribosomal-protein-alanine N-acetyltransferase
MTPEVGLDVLATHSSNIREASPADLPQIMKLEQESETAAHWAEADYSRIFADIDRGDHLLKNVVLVAEANDRAQSLIGFIVARAIGRDWEIENIVVSASAKREGNGSRLLRALIERARRELAENVLLEVRESNQAAIALYEKGGFKQDGRRRNYYSNPEEDALLLRLAI